ncbi:3-deoxy-D-manno-octulosonic acid transferase [Phaeobacter gallaeciensis]|uniref:3-deoxy-D-manno-octulosonic acid transferase n=2 Tax=Roseobacteraceae TaxID=2854170 RepID=A0A366WNS4_9RHOB|nr:MULTISPECIES: 3-deoxy-D-manno-octulosonic acid transferase [Roseobacteraceae]MBT3143018.1 3-deoxy-D-manno-octulosonic acid transferase [Falsiruegeria litorea]MBT8166877.1 3-deoxy-D-manno-octulosonic acid transferase [Falsiruegeria litorea]RBW51550.1 3-deoxy-D-manno-octulosonic acid transferase [Phaeobacter gallaeciensis]
MSRPNGGKATLLYYAYRAISAVLAPFAWYSVARKLRRAHVPVERQHERLGVASQPRPAGQLIWFHAASVGESLSVLSLITRMGERLPQAQFLITSGTPTSAALIAKRLPPRTIHQYPPLDANGPVNRFYHHWRPNAGIFVESELWPQMLVKGRKAGVHLALLNARLSDKSVRGWQRFPDTAQFILGQFDLFLTQNQKTANNLRAMGAVPERVKPGTNLKALAGPLPVDEVLCARMRKSIGDRPVWVASSTHPGEEEVVLQTHRALLKRHPDLLLLLIPRHPDRGQDVQQLIANFGFTCARRSKQEDISPETEVYLADTLGETGTWYALCPLVFLGGSLQDIGGHNPFEPAQAGAAVITGPGFFNFAETFDAMIAAGGAVEVRDAVDLTAAVDKWLGNQSNFEAACTAARSYVNTQQTALDSVIDTLCEELKL